VPSVYSAISSEVDFGTTTWSSFRPDLDQVLIDPTYTLNDAGNVSTTSAETKFLSEMAGATYADDVKYFQSLIDQDVGQPSGTAFNAVYELQDHLRTTLPNVKVYTPVLQTTNANTPCILRYVEPHRGLMYIRILISYMNMLQIRRCRHLRAKLQQCLIH